MSFPDLFAAPDWMPTFVALCAVALITLLWSYARSPAAPWVRLTCATLKAAGVLLLGLCLLEPMQSSQVPKAGANLFVVLADASQSLQVHDSGQRQSREELLRRKIVTDNTWQETLDESFDLRRYTFARQVESSQFTSFDAQGMGSSIVTALESVGQRFRNRPIAGILLLTDGNATDTGTGEIAWADLPPVYPVVVGKDQPQADVSISGFSVSQTNFEAAPVTIAANLDTSGFRNETIKTQLLDEAGEIVDEQLVYPEDGQQVMAVRFNVRPEQPGISVYRMRAAAESQFAAFDDPELVSEATLANNERAILVDRARGPYRILYVSGRPNWEFKFLRRALLEDDEIDLVGLIRIAREEPKFTFRSHRDESTNPLFRGFGNDEDEDAERFDEPVLVRLGTRDAEELRDGFPKSAEELFEYHAIVLDDVEAGFFDEDQKALIQEFVNTRGGGFLMLGGQETFRQGKYDRTPIGELLPVYIDTRIAKPADAGFQLNLTREGWLQPWVRLESTEEEEQQRLEGMPGFDTINAVRAIKPGASVMATVSTLDSQALPALVAQRFGKGRAAALLIGDFWKWHLHSDQGNDDLLKAWRQTMRWLVADVPRRVDVDIRENRDANLSVQLRVQVNDAAFQPLDNAAVTIVVTRPDGAEVSLTATPLDEAAGLFGVTYVPRIPGSYRVNVEARAADGSVIGTRQNGWVSEPASDEFSRLRPNREFLKRVASQTGGEVIEIDELDRFAARLPARKAPLMETRIRPWWHTLSIFLLALGCFVFEWGLRRWKGLP